jgi:hypothetical protein
MRTHRQGAVARQGARVDGEAKAIQFNNYELGKCPMRRAKMKQQTKPYQQTVGNSGYGRTRTLHQVYQSFIEGCIPQSVLFEKMRHIPHGSLQLVLHGVTVLRNERACFVDVLDSIVNTLRFDLRGTRVLERTKATNGADWTIGCADDVAPRDVIGQLVEHVHNYIEKEKHAMNHYDYRALSEVKALLLWLRRGHAFIAMQHNVNGHDSVALTGLWMLPSLEEAKAVIPTVTMLQVMNGVGKGK